LKLYDMKMNAQYAHNSHSLRSLRLPILPPILIKWGLAIFHLKPACDFKLACCDR